MNPIYSMLTKTIVEQHPLTHSIPLVFLLYPLKTLGKPSFLMFSRGIETRPLTWNGLTSTGIFIVNAAKHLWKLIGKLISCLWPFSLFTKKLNSICLAPSLIRLRTLSVYPTGICSFKVNNVSIRNMCEICSKITLTTYCYLWIDFTHCPGDFIGDFEQINLG